MATSTKERKFAPGSEPAQKFTPPAESTEVNPNTGIPYFTREEGDQLRAAVYALASGDTGAARRALFLDADEGINVREADEVANPVPSPKHVDKVAKQNLEGTKERVRLEQEDPPQVIGAHPPKEEEAKDLATVTEPQKGSGK
jgi:hypothetical protein